jgi:hypothetical protein
LSATLNAMLRRMLSLSGWAVFQHGGVGLLLLSAIVMGNQVAGGVVGPPPCPARCSG